MLDKSTILSHQKAKLCEFYKFDRAKEKASRIGGEIQDSALLLSGCAFLCSDLIDGLTIVEVWMGEEPCVKRTYPPSEEKLQEEWRKYKARDRLSQN